jgi:hypothetical protein
VADYKTDDRQQFIVEGLGCYVYNLGSTGRCNEREVGVKNITKFRKIPQNFRLTSWKKNNNNNNKK